MSHKRSTLEQGFITIYRRMFASAPQYIREFKFHPTRQWRLDFAWPKYRVGVEIDGGIFLGGTGRHNRGVQFTADAEKHNALTMLGWRLLRFTTLDMQRRPMQVAEEVVALLAKIRPRELAEQQGLFETEF